MSFIRCAQRTFSNVSLFQVTPSVTRILCIKGEDNIRYNISYTCAQDTPLVVEHMIYEHVGNTNAKVFEELPAYYELVVNRNLNRVYFKNYNVSLRFAGLTF
jgi:hypothetical protein